ncbi:hypothetical protein LshimejAT787_0208250 [Lyophyllum shimeji]|uniref:Uncharacterized protein n=1 Tax=Lyophyllum shimeji TaxID=47721 RepID=A0A9P3UL60_LYOSH|nr:hypothetical protein LshimejAT787_0208250 [Lyophyllum shimeji]
MTSSARTLINALIDHGAPPALISSGLVKKLNLQTRPLHRPLGISGAFSPDGHGPLELSTFVRLSVLSPCAQWQSRSQIFIVCPDLHTDVILGLDFLAKNDIVIDAHNRTAIDKKCGFDLLNPPDPTLARVPPKTTPYARRKAEAKSIKEGQAATRELRKQVHFELAAKFVKEAKKFDFSANTTEPDFVGMVRTRIEQLASAEV